MLHELFGILAANSTVICAIEQKQTSFGASFWRSWEGASTVRKKLILFWAFLKRQYVYFRRYLFNSLGGMLTLYVVFLLILGLQGVGCASGTEGIPWKLSWWVTCSGSF